MFCNIIEVLYISILCMCSPIYIHVYNEQYPCDTKYSWSFSPLTTLRSPKGRFVPTRTVSPWSTQSSSETSQTRRNDWGQSNETYWRPKSYKKLVVSTYHTWEINCSVRRYFQSELTQVGGSHLTHTVFYAHWWHRWNYGGEGATPNNHGSNRCSEIEMWIFLVLIKNHRIIY